MRLPIVLSIVVPLAFPTDKGWADEQLVYLLMRQQVGLPPHSRLFSVVPGTKEQRLLFSDQTAPLKLTLGVSYGIGEHGRKVFVSAKKTAFAYAYAAGRSMVGNTSILELSVDGSNRFRKAVPAVEDYLGEVHQPLSQVFVDPAGTLVGYVSYQPLDKWPLGPTIVIHERATGRLVRRINLTKRFLGNYVVGIGWMPDAKRLYFTLDAYEPHAPDEAYGKLGTYLIDADGTGLARLPASSTSSDFVPICVGARPDGTLLMREMAYRGVPQSYLYLVNPAKRSRTPVGLGRSANLDYFRLSHDGKRVAFMEILASAANDGEVQFRIWVKDLVTGAEQMVVPLVAQGDGYWPTLVGWIE